MIILDKLINKLNQRIAKEKPASAKIKVDPEDFLVDEIPAYEFNGEGEHAYLHVQKRLQTTEEIVTILKGIFGCHDRDIGYAGKKDKFAVTQQYFSVKQPWHRDLSEIQKQIEDASDIKILAMHKHINKLKLGHLKGNRFKIILRDYSSDVHIDTLMKQITEQGVMNYVSSQRFGHDHKTLAIAYDLMAGKTIKKRWLRQLALSAWQSALFNIYLDLRLESNNYNELLKGDVALKLENDAPFIVEDAALEQNRFDTRDIVYSGPFFGYKMKAAEYDAATLEAAIIDEFDVDLELLKNVDLVGERRPAIIYPGEFEYKLTGDVLELSFSLRKGAYATTVIESFCSGQE